VVPSLCYENLPTVILEALNNNLAVIGSKLGGIKDMLSEEQLLFTPIEDDLVRILNWCLTNQVALKQLTQQVKQKIKLITVDDYLLRVGEKLKITF
jgi:glycosyltransferase involved in cell wall biosynthesis